MRWFIKTETFTQETASLPIDQRRPHLEAHRRWVMAQSRLGRRIRSGYLVDGEGRPGGGGLLIFDACSYEEALSWVQADPMIQAGLVTWTLQEWIQISGDKL